MIKIAFCGHSDFSKSGQNERMLTLIEGLVGGEDVEFYNGYRGNFDCFAAECVKEYKSKHANAKSVFFTPYLSENYNGNVAKRSLFDEIVYPGLEGVPLKFAIVKRNEVMIESCDVLICYIKRTFGGAYKAYEYARKRNKRIVFFN